MSADRQILDLKNEGDQKKMNQQSINQHKTDQVGEPSPSPLDIVRRHDLLYPDAPRFWQDGHILGNGDLGAIAYAPSHVAWTINKTDVFDARKADVRFLKDSEVREHLRQTGARNLKFLDEAEACQDRTGIGKSCGIVKMSFGNEHNWNSRAPHKIEQGLSLADATCRLKLDMHLSHPRLRSFVAADRNVLACRIDNVSGGGWAYQLQLVQPFDLEWPSPAQWGTSQDTVWFVQEMPGGGCYAMVMTAVQQGAAAPDDAFNRAVRSCYKRGESQLAGAGQLGDRAWLSVQGHADFFLAVATSYESADPLAHAQRLARETREAGFEPLEQRHRQWWRDFWSKSRIELPDAPDLERSWYFSLYETGSLHRRAPVPGLYGLWYGHTDEPLGGLTSAHYTHDQNIQIPVMPVFAVNHPELAEPFMDTYLNILPELLRQTREVYQRPGVCLPLGMDQLGQAIPSGGYRYSLIGSAYSGLMFVWAYRFTQNEQWLSDRIYPFLREVTRFYSAWMLKQPDGKYCLDIMIPPEIFTLARNECSTLALFKPCLELAIEASRKLGGDEAERKGWEALLEHYPEIPSCDGIWQSGENIDLNHPVQAAYLLYPLFPGDGNTAYIRETTARTLDRLHERDVELSYADDVGRRHFTRSWSHFFPTMALLRLGRKEEGWALLLDSLRTYHKPNGLVSHNAIVEVASEISERSLNMVFEGKLVVPGEEEPVPLSEKQSASDPVATLNPLAKRLVVPVSEGNGASLMMITETLLQSHGGCIRLFPGLPESQRARFENLRAEGAFLVCAERNGNEVTFVCITAEVGGTARVENPWGTHPVAITDSSGKQYLVSGKMIEIALSKGDKMRLCPSQHA